MLVVKESLEMMVEKKLNNIGITAKTKTYATALQENQEGDKTRAVSVNFEVKNNILVEETDRKRRKNNIRRAQGTTY